MKMAYLLFAMAIIDLPLIILAYMNAHWSVATICALSLIGYRGEQLLRIQREVRREAFRAEQRLKVKEIINSIGK